LPARSGMGEEVAAVFVLDANGQRAAIEAAVERVNQSLPSHQRISRLEFQADDLPKTSTLKVQRSKVQERYAKKSGAAAPVPLSPQSSVLSPPAEPGSAFVEVARAVAEVATVKLAPADVSPAMKLQMDLGIDSIGRVELLTNLESRLNVTIPQEHEGKLFTVRDVITVVEAAQQSGAGKKSKAPRPLISGDDARMDGVRSGMRESFSKSLLQGLFGTTASVFMNTYLRIECSGRENLPASGAYILAANHCSHLDSVAIREALGRRASGLYVMGAKDYFFDTHLKSWFFTTFLNALPFDREENAAESLAACKTVLDGGRAILLFPEGTRSLTGELQPFKPGIGVLGIELDAPVIPVSLKGTFESLPKGKALPRPMRIEVRIGPPVDFSKLKAQRGTVSTSELYRKAATELRAKVEALGN